ncbi:MAG TPA: hypothetical protein VJ576_06980 [Rhodocyclaceae bacterium]|nr:hypothetical protein [Rhodocyclaceae bacterium]
MPTPFNVKDIRRLLDNDKAPCLSLYQPTFRAFPDSDQNPIRFQHLLRDLERMLAETADPATCQRLLAPLYELAGDRGFWAHPRDGLVALRTPDLFRVYQLQRPVPELLVVSDSLHLKPLLRIVQSADRFQVLCLDRDKVRLFEGNRHALDEADLAPAIPRTLADALGDQLTPGDQTGFTGGRGLAMRHGSDDKGVAIDQDRQRYFEMVDQGVLEYHSGADEVPLILAALPDNQGHFRALSHNPFLLPRGIDLNPFALDADHLRELAWHILQPYYRQRLDRLINEYGESRARDQGTDDLERAGEAGANSRIRTLLVDADRHVRGRLHRDTGKVERLADGASDSEDLLEDLMELTLQRGGEVVVVPHDRMPTESGIAAIYRY